MSLLKSAAVGVEDGVGMKGVVEALLFASDTPLAGARIREVIGEITDEEIHEIVESLREDYRESGRSFDIYTIEGGFQVLSRPEFADWIEQLFVEKRKAKLSRASLETLAIIAYKQPIVKTEIEMIRGVGADGVIRTLMERNLVTITGRAEGVGRPLLYGTTAQFLNYFGLAELTDLPKMEEIREILRGEASESSA
ncbi:MAG: SMC-Scp complex subunit ScpB [bacterium]